MHRVNIGFLLAGLVFLPGCIRVPSYSRKPLKSVSDNPTYRKIEQNVIVQAKRLTEENIQSLFNSRSPQKKDSFEVIYLSIHNVSTLSYQLRSADIGCEILPYQKVVRDMKTSSTIRLASSIIPIAATAFQSLFCLLIGTFVFNITPVIFYGGVSLGATGISLGLMSFGRGIKSIVMNTRIRKDIKEKIVPKEVIIKSGDYYEGLIFVKSSDYKAKFNVVISDTNNRHKNLIFEVDLQQV